MSVRRIWLLLLVTAHGDLGDVCSVFTSAFVPSNRIHNNMPRTRIKLVVRDDGRRRPCSRPILLFSQTKEEEDKVDVQQDDPQKKKANPFSIFSKNQRGGAQLAQATKVQKQILQQQEVQQKQARRVLQTLQALEQQMEQYQVQQEKLFQAKARLWEAKGGNSNGNSSHDDNADNEYYVSANKTLQEFQSIQEELPLIQQKWSVRSGYTEAQDGPSPELDPRQQQRRQRSPPPQKDKIEDEDNDDAVTPELIDMISIDREKELLKEQRRLERLVALLEEQLEQLKDKSLEPEVTIPSFGSGNGGDPSTTTRPMNNRERNLFLAEQDRLESEVALLESQLLQVRNDYREEAARTEELQRKVEDTQVQLEEQALQLEKMQRQQQALVPVQRRRQQQQRPDGFFPDGEQQGGLLEEIESLQDELLQVQTLYERELGKTQMLQQVIETNGYGGVAELLDELQEEGIQRQLVLEEQEMQIAELESQLLAMGVSPQY